MIQDSAEVQRAIGRVRCGQALLVEPAGHAGTGDPIQRQGSEGRHESRIDEPGRVLSCRRLAPVEIRLPRTRDEFSECRDHVACGRVGRCSGLDGEALGARLLDAHKRHRPEGNPARAALALPPAY